LGLDVAILVAVDVRIVLTWSGLRFGRTLSRSAATPETMAAACDVPDPRKNRPPKTALGYCRASVDPGERSP
jgi:hypothetical protein